MYGTVKGQQIMKKIFILLIIVLFLLTWGCKTEGETKIKPLVIKENPDPASVRLKMIKQVVVDDVVYNTLYVSENKIYVSGKSIKERVNLLKIFDLNLNHLENRSFPIGQGPGDVGGGTQFFFTPNQILVPDNTQERISIFDHNFKFIRFLIYDSGPITFINFGRHFLRHKFTAAKGRQMVLEILLVSYPGLKKTRLYRYGPYERARDKNKRHILGNQSSFHYFGRGEFVYLLDKKEYTIGKYDLKGKLAKSIKVNFKKIDISGQNQKKWLIDLVGKRIANRFVLYHKLLPTSKIIPLGKGFVVIRRKDYNQDCTGMVEADYFNFDLNLKGKVVFPCFMRFNRVSTGYNWPNTGYVANHLYLTVEKGEETYLEKWLVTE